MSNHDREGSHPSNRDAPLERAWRETSVEQPPARLDAAIVAAARQSVTDRGPQTAPVPPRASSRTWLTRWQPLATAATVAGLAFVVVQMLPREPNHPSSSSRQESAPAAPAAQPPTQDSVALDPSVSSQAPSVDNTVDASRRVGVAVEAPIQGAVPAPSAEQAPPAQPAAPAAKAETTPSDSAELARASRADRNSAASAEPAGRTAPVEAAARSSNAGERHLGTAAPLDAPAWAAKIATLHAAGEFAAAEQALRDFRAADSDADLYLPESLRGWARTVN